MPFLCINKQKDWTSHDVVAKLRGITGIKKIGHAGTLDPFATGVLIVGIERDSTKQLDEFKNFKKEYVVDIIFGATSTTQDRTGEITKYENPKKVTKKNLEDVIKDFLGYIEQIPPMYSAKKIGGKKLYELARKGEEIERKPHKVTIYKIEIINLDNNSATLKVVCSTGTYIRTLVNDIGLKLDCGAYAQELTRTRIKDHGLDKCVEISDVTKENWKDHSFDLKNQTTS